MQVKYVGHSTVLVELDGLRVLTDPVLRGRVAHIRRTAPEVDVDAIRDVDLVLVSHLHHDHFDGPSLQMLARSATLVVPRGAGRQAAKLGFSSVTELAVGDQLRAGGVTVSGTYAAHRKGRVLAHGSEAIGYTIAGTQHVYFAGDTDIFPGMRDLRGRLDLALLPVGGWGPKLGPGHLDAHRAAAALELLAPRVAVPIHWGTLLRIGMRRAHRVALDRPPRAFAEAAAREAPSVEVRILAPGEVTTVEPAGV